MKDKAVGDIDPRTIAEYPFTACEFVCASGGGLYLALNSSTCRIFNRCLLTNFTDSETELDPYHQLHKQ